MGLLGLLLKDWEEGFEKFGKTINEAVFPFVDTYFENDEIKVAIDLAGFEDSDIDELEIKGSTLIVSGKRESIKNKKTITPLVLHRPLRFRSIILLPLTTKENETPKFTKHPIENGVLTITIHKATA
jgi:HSP20 family molecular chaperone IbpA